MAANAVTGTIMTIHKLKSIKILGVNTEEYIGSVGTIFYDDVDGALRLSDGETLGGIDISAAGSGESNRLINGSHTVTLGSTGIVTLPSSSYLESTNINLKVGAQGTVTIRSNAESNLTTKSWTFGTDGTLTLPAGGDIVDNNGSSVLGTPTLLDGGTASTVF